jgi:hypothetical protein
LVEWMVLEAAGELHALDTLYSAPKDIVFKPGFMQKTV